MFENRRNLGELLFDGLSNKLLGSLRARSRRHGEFRHIVVPIDDVIGLRVMATGRWELTTLDAVRTLLASPHSIPGLQTVKGGTFIDVGANIGLYSIALSKYFDRTVAFEPNPITFMVLEANLALSKTQTSQAFCLGVSSAQKQANLYMPSDGNLGWSTLSPERHSADANVAATVIELDTLDNLSKTLGFEQYPVSLIKIDVEGHEAEVLQGAMGILNRWGPIVLVEVLAGPAGRASFEILKSCGYSRYYGFRRSLSPARGLRRYWESLTRGLPVTFVEYDITNPKPAQLVCALKSS